MQDPKDQLTYKVAKIDDFSIFCDWENMDQNRIDVQALSEQALKGSSGKLEELLTKEFADHEDDHRYILDNFTVELQFKINKDI